MSSKKSLAPRGLQIMRRFAVWLDNKGYTPQDLANLTALDKSAINRLMQQWIQEGRP